MAFPRHFDTFGCAIVSTARNPAIAVLQHSNHLTSLLKVFFMHIFNL